MVFLTQNSGFLVGQISWLLGNIMNAIFIVVDFIGIPNIGLTIIIFTMVANLLMTPLTIRQQKFSKLSAKLSPEVQAVQAKYKGRKDNESMMAQNQEIQAVYAKYGISPTGSCLPLLVQLPIIWALYYVVRSVPAYVGRVKAAFFPLVDELIQKAGSKEMIQAFKNSAQYANKFTNPNFVEGTVTPYVQNVYVDCLNKATEADFGTIATQFPDLSTHVDQTMTQLSGFNNFLGINIGYSPSDILSDAWNKGAWLLVIGAIMIPFLAAATQWINVKLMPQQATNTSGDERAKSMASSMKVMNNVMPIMSAFFCFTLPSGMGLYWIASSVFRSVQQVVINKQMDKVNFEELIKKNSVKSAKKLQKIELQRERMNQYASMKTRNISTIAQKAGTTQTQSGEAPEQTKGSAISASNTASAKPGSIMAKANMVKQFNEKNNTKKDSN